jgi:hypothetical protein
MKHIFTLFAILYYSVIFSQNISLDEVVKLRKNDIGHVEEYLTAKDWSFLEASEPTFETMGSATFTYKKDNYSDAAQSFLTFIYSGYSETRRIGIQINKADVYNTYLARIKALGCKLIDSKIEEGNIIKIYRGQTTTFKITTATVTGDFDAKKTTYYILLFDNEDYDLSQRE